MKYIYLDWNVMKDIQKNYESDFSNKIFALKNEFLIPYSFAHLADLQKKCCSETMPFIFYDLVSLNKITDGIMIGIYKDEFGIDRINVFDKFKEITSYNNKIVSSIVEEDVSLIKEIGLKEYLLTSDNLKKYPEIMRIAHDRFNSDSELYKLNRDIFSDRLVELDDDIKDFAKALDALQNNTIASDVFLKAVDLFINYQREEPVSLSEKLTYAYALLEYIPQFREKISKKSSFSNIYGDSQHMLSAIRAKVYVTNDSATIKKTKFIFSVFNIECEVLKPKEFLNYDI